MNGHEVCDEKFKAIAASVATGFEQINKTLESVVIQTTKTNGRVTALEKWKDRGFTTAVVIVTLFGGNKLVQKFLAFVGS